MVSNVYTKKYSLWEFDKESDSYKMYRLMQKHDPVFWDENENLFVVTRFKDVDYILKSVEFNASLGRDFLCSKEHFKSQKLRAHYDRWMVFSGGKSHFKQRSIFTDTEFSEVTNFSISAARIAAQRICRNRISGEFELISNFVDPIVTAYVRSMFNLNEEEFLHCRKISRELISILNMESNRQKIDSAYSALADLTYLVNRKLNDAGKSIFTLLRRAIDDDMVSVDDAVASVSQILTGSIEPVSHAIGNGVITLLNNPENMTRLWNKDVEMGAVVTELLRLETPFQYVPRVSLKDVSFHKVQIPSGTRVICMLGAANRDETVFSFADQLNFDRTPNRIASFGLGPHSCLGIRAARELIGLAIETLRSKYPIPGTIHLRSATRVPSFGMNGYEKIYLSTSSK